MVSIDAHSNYNLGTNNATTKQQVLVHPAHSYKNKNIGLLLQHLHSHQMRMGIVQGLNQVTARLVTSNICPPNFVQMVSPLFVNVTVTVYMLPLLSVNMCLSLYVTLLILHIRKYRKVWLLSTSSYATSEEWIKKFDLIVLHMCLITKHTIKLNRYMVNFSQWSSIIYDW